MIHSRSAIALVAALLAMTTIPVVAQSRQPFSLQLSGEKIFPTKDYGSTLPTNSTLGWEVQARYTFGRFSIGAGYQRSTVFKSTAANLTGTISVVFIEPRYVIGVIGDRVAPYLAARAGAGALLIRDVPRVTNNSLTYGAGVGVLIAVVPHVSIDVGGQYFMANFGGNGGSAGYFLGRVGLAFGLF